MIKLLLDRLDYVLLIWSVSHIVHAKYMPIMHAKHEWHMHVRALCLPLPKRCQEYNQ